VAARAEPPEPRVRHGEAERLRAGTRNKKRPLMPDDDLLRPREVAEIFGVRAATIARWAREGRITPLRNRGGAER
jgi:hypothetical protein